MSFLLYLCRRWNGRNADFFHFGSSQGLRMLLKESHLHGEHLSHSNGSWQNKQLRGKVQTLWTWDTILQTFCSLPSPTTELSLQQDAIRIRGRGVTAGLHWIKRKTHPDPLQMYPPLLTTDTSTFTPRRSRRDSSLGADNHNQAGFRPREWERGGTTGRRLLAWRLNGEGLTEPMSERQICFRVGPRARANLQDWDKFRGESIGSPLTSLPLFVLAAIFKARNAVPVERWRNSKQVH